MYFHRVEPSSGADPGFIFCFNSSRLYYGDAVCGVCRLLFEVACLCIIYLALAMLPFALATRHLLLAIALAIRHSPLATRHWPFAIIMYTRHTIIYKRSYRPRSFLRCGVCLPTIFPYYIIFPYFIPHRIAPMHCLHLHCFHLPQLPALHIPHSRHCHLLHRSPPH